MTAVETALASIYTAIQRFADVLAEDALEPLGSYSIDGESCNQNEWRESIARTMEDLSMVAEKLQTDVGRELGIEWLGKVPSERIPYEQRS